MHVFSIFQNSITLARNNIFPYRKKFLVAAILLYKKQHKKWKSTSERPPSPLALLKRYKLSISGIDFESFPYFVDVITLHFSMFSSKGGVRSFITTTLALLECRTWPVVVMMWGGKWYYFWRRLLGWSSLVLNQWYQSSHSSFLYFPVLSSWTGLVPLLFSMGPHQRLRLLF